MLDEYIFGQATRISQEAPVMVVRQSETRAVPGGAANVANNMVALGAAAEVVGVVGKDSAGETLKSSLEQSGIACGGVVFDPSRPTTRKTRVLANHSQQVLRIDHEVTTPVEASIEDSVIARALQTMEMVDVVLISDYQKGSVTSRTIHTLIEEGARRNIPVVANPKPRSLHDYRNAALVSLNRFEASEALGLKDALADNEAEAAAVELQARYGVQQIVVTLGGSGMAAAGARGAFRVPALRVEVYDEAGAGDTVIATLALGMGTGMFGKELLELAAATSGTVVQKVGVAVPTPEDLAAIAERSSI